jgi:K+-sensing histidine kinase KdpD
MLAAISHDLRTPLTLLRLRTENVENSTEREKMLATIAEMDAMVATTLAFARDEATEEARRPTDLAALVQSIVDDMADTGLPVKMEPAQSVVQDCRPAALKRAIRNVIDNAVKYGKKANVGINRTAKSIEITVDDEGPGIAEHELSRVFEPFYRVEESRSPETGGVGLGLAIALSTVQAHGGEIILSNRPAGGLRSSVVLPRWKKWRTRGDGGRQQWEANPIPFEVWQIPQGGISTEETPRPTLMRELKEEIGTDHVKAEAVSRRLLRVLLLWFCALLAGTVGAMLTVSRKRIADAIF